MEFDNMELWDAYDNCFNKIENITLIRGNTIPKGYYHLVCDIIVRHVDGTYLIMQRDFKKHLGGLWEATAGGSALSGETPIECAKRELFEETGIKQKRGCYIPDRIASFLTAPIRSYRRAVHK